ncbi:hypothetical protein OHT68_48730 (plasmid) [Streptomyces canus]|uniref:hypothetical protein n=1 Tax=Streptomyces canus TaxID=58343 RepID=UPI002E27C9DA|nr:hypothetical protein [Streptomyces canus]
MVSTHLEQTERHGRCQLQPYAYEVEHMHGVHRFQMDCSGWHAGRWTKDVTASEVAALVRAFFDAALAAQDGRLPATPRERGDRHAATSLNRASRA